MALGHLHTMIIAPNARDEECIYATENAISAITKICRFNNSCIDVNAALQFWVEALPIVHEEQEAVTTYEFLIQLVESGNPSVVGPNNSNFPKIFYALAEALAADVLPVSMRPQAGNIMKAIVENVDVSARGTLWGTVEPEKQQTLKKMGYYW